MKKLTQIAGLTAIVLTLGVGVTACGQSGPSAADSETLTWGVSSSPEALDIAHGFDAISISAQRLLLDTVLGVTSDGELVPGIAEKWETPDPLTYVFHLRKDATFWNGDPVTADDVVFSLKRHLDPEVGSQAAVSVAAVKDVIAVDDSTVRVEMTTPDRQFLAVSALIWQVVQQSFAEEHAEDLGSPEVLTMGSGPYSVNSFSSADGLKLERNDEYWGNPGAFESVDMTIVPDAETLRSAIANGKIDGTFGVPSSELGAWEGTDGIAVHTAKANRTYYLSFDTTEAPLDDVHVRRAIAAATDREGIMQAVTAGRGTLAFAPMPFSQVVTAAAGEDAVEDYLSALPEGAYDLDLARRELAQSAHPDGFDLTVRYMNSDPGYAKVLQAMSASLQEIGINVILKEQTREAWGAQMWAHEELGMQVMSAMYISAEPAETLPDILSAASAKPNGYGTAQYTTPTLETLIERLRAATDAELGDAAMAVLKENAEVMAYFPLFYPLQAVAVNESVDYLNYGTFNGQWHDLVVPADQ